METNRKQKILFLVATEYHTLVSLSAIADKYNDSTKFEITFCRLISKNEQPVRNHTSLEHVRFTSLQFEFDNLTLTHASRDEVKALINQRFDIFVFFNDVDLAGIYLAKVLKQQKAQIILAPDGMKTFGTHPTFRPRWLLKFALRYRRFRKINELEGGGGLFLPSMRYAHHKEIDTVWVQSESHYINWNSKKVEEIKVMETSQAIEAIAQFFQFDINAQMPVRSKVVFLICLPPKFEKLEVWNKNLISYLSENFPTYTLMLKLHPSTSSVQISELSAIPNCIAINSSYPAELYISNLKDSVVISYWSTASLVYNPTCRYYWLYRILEKENLMPFKVQIVNPTDHIVEVESMNQIQ